MFENVKTAIFYAAHTDDEMICAGTLHRLAAQRVRVIVVAFSPAATEGDRTGNDMSDRIVEPEWHRSMDAIGVRKENRFYLGMTPSAKLASRNQEVCQYVYDSCTAYKPDLAFVLSPEDENTAHAMLGTECERVMRGRVPMTVRCQFPWNYGIGRPNLFVSLDPDDLLAKQSVIRAYSSQHFRYNYEEMLMSQARADGLSVKKGPCEKFELIRGVV